MNFDGLKRKVFFWVDRLQISKTERVGIAILLGLVAILLSASLFLQKSLNYDQEEYDQIVAEFERRSALIQKEEKELAEKYSPTPAVSNSAGEMEVPKETASETEAEEVEPVSDIVNINTASLQQLQTLDGIGPAYAQRILDYREANDGFDSIDELVNVKGIGEKRLENIRPYIKLED